PRHKNSAKTYNSADSLMVTHLTTGTPVDCLYMAERTGSLVLSLLWSYVKDHPPSSIYILPIHHLPLLKYHIPTLSPHGHALTAIHSSNTPTISSPPQILANSSPSTSRPSVFHPDHALQLTCAPLSSSSRTSSTFSPAIAKCSAVIVP
ncbi:hypothetical protein BU23DRAFT_457060, partial [Bimuria novae-zelandiae CBS 107.79]